MGLGQTRSFAGPPPYSGRISEREVSRGICRKRGCSARRCELITLERIALDIDEPDDVRELLKQDLPSPIRHLLLEMGIEGRIRKESLCGF